MTADSQIDRKSIAPFNSAIEENHSKSHFSTGPERQVLGLYLGFTIGAAFYFLITPPQIYLSNFACLVIVFQAQFLGHKLQPTLLICSLAQRSCSLLLNIQSDLMTSEPWQTWQLIATQNAWALVRPVTSSIGSCELSKVVVGVGVSLSLFCQHLLTKELRDFQTTHWPNAAHQLALVIQVLLVHCHAHLLHISHDCFPSAMPELSRCKRPYSSQCLQSMIIQSLAGKIGQSLS